MSGPRVGVLVLQGSAEPHRAAFARLGVDARAVRGPADLDGLTHLVLPGGESTTLRRLLDLFGLAAPIVAAASARELALFGTCAGAILLGADAGEPPARLGLLDVDVERNAYGRQLASRVVPLELADAAEPAGNPSGASAGGPARPFQGVFIRSPRIARVGPGVEVLAREGADPVLVRGPGVLAATFHPELTDDPSVHRAFLERDAWAAFASAGVPSAAGRA